MNGEEHFNKSTTRERKVQGDEPFSPGEGDNGKQTPAGKVISDGGRERGAQRTLEPLPAKALEILHSEEKAIKDEAFHPSRKREQKT